MFILSKLLEDATIYNSILIYHRSCPIIFISKLNILEIYKVTNGDLVEVDAIELKGKIQSFCKINIKDQDLVLFVNDQFEIGLIYSNGESSIIVHILNKLSIVGQQQNYDSKPTLIPSSYKNPKFIVLSIFHSNLQILNLNSSFEIAQSSNKKRKFDQKLFNLNSIPVGNISIKQIITLNNPELIVILYKDPTSESFFIRSYILYNNKLELYKQYSEFEEEPSLIVPLQDGFLVLMPGKLVYFPFTKKDISAPKGVTISTREETYIMKRLSTSRPFQTYTIIDESRILLVNDAGENYMLYMGLDLKNQSLFLINQLNFLNLGVTTIPDSYQCIFHIGNDLFLQISKVSKSVLFQILPNKPHIHIKSQIETSPPIVDMKYEEDILYTCQGSWEGSEIRKYSSTSYEVDVLKSNKFESLHSCELFGDKLYIEQWNSTDNGKLNKRVFNLKLHEQISEYEKSFEVDDWSCKFEDDRIIINGELRNEKVDCKVIYPVDKLVVCATNGEIFIYSMKRAFQFPHLFEEDIQSIDVVKVSDSFLIFINDLSGLYKVFKSDLEMHEILYESQLNGLLNSKILSDCLILLTSEGILHQIHFNQLATNFIASSVSQRLDDKIMKLIKFDDKFIAYNENHLFLFDKQLDYYKSNEVNIQSNIKFVEFIQSNILLTVYENGLVQIIQLTKLNTNNSLSYNSIYSKLLFTKILPIAESEYLISLEYDNSTGELKTIFNLIEKSTWCIIHSLPFDKIEFIDICHVPITLDSYSAIFVALKNNTYPFYIFGIRNDSIHLLQQCNIEKFKLTPEITFQSISSYKDKICISGNVLLNLSINLTNEDKFEFEIFEDGFKLCQAYATEQSITNETIYISDILSGIFSTGKEYKNNESTYLVKFDVPTDEYSTSISTLKYDRTYNYALIGDSIGNITFVKERKDEEYQQKVGVESYFSFQSGDQVNKIVAVNKMFDSVTQLFLIGTVSGGIYMMSETTSKEIDEIIQKKNISLSPEANIVEQSKLLEISNTKVSMDIKESIKQICFETSYVL
ncbi:unnamed protein product [Candida verbasci]|uniref:Cleavage/polyadenylation specificity factor A subunit C-terminal domain-containing protein n=1 Tax=Candida verbasci TaxID=1227364 RepID=A0A9W4TV32_9ASCO|nr:unnamed protein product [Candida verbasci]